MHPSVLISSGLLLFTAACGGASSAITTLPAVAIAAHDMADKPERLKEYAEKGDVYAMHQLGEYYDGQNLPEALTWYCKAARRSFVKSQMRLGAYYEEKDTLKAAMWYSLAARQGRREALEARTRTTEHLSEKERAAITPMMNSWKSIPCGVREDEATSSPARTRPPGQ